MKSSPIRQSKPFRLISSKAEDPFWNMALDEAIFKEVSAGHSPPTLRFYTFASPSISIGYFQNPAADLNLDLMKTKKIPWVRRMTGGRGIFHHIELTYSFSAPSGLTSPFFPNNVRGTYHKIALGFQTGLQKLNLPLKLYAGTDKQSQSGLKQKGGSPRLNPLCFSSPSWFEPMIEEKKIIGSAQKRFKNGFLQQGSILLHHRVETFGQFFQLRPEDDRDFIGIFDFLKKEIPLDDLEEMLAAGFEEAWGVSFEKEDPSDREIETCKKLVCQKYSTTDWNMNRKTDSNP